MNENKMSPNMERLVNGIKEIAEYVTDRIDLYEEEFAGDGTWWECTVYGYETEYTVHVYNKNVSVEDGGNPRPGCGVNITYKLFDEYHQNLHDYICACQGAPMGYLPKEMTIEEVKTRIVADLEELMDDDEESEV